MAPKTSMTPTKSASATPPSSSSKRAQTSSPKAGKDGRHSANKRTCCGKLCGCCMLLAKVVALFSVIGVGKWTVDKQLYPKGSCVGWEGSDSCEECKTSIGWMPFSLRAFSGLERLAAAGAARQIGERLLAPDLKATCSKCKQGWALVPGPPVKNQVFKNKNGTEFSWSTHCAEMLVEEERQVLMIRHGQSTWNAQLEKYTVALSALGMFIGEDAPLSKLGLKQAQRFANILRKADAEVYGSDPNPSAAELAAARSELDTNLEEEVDISEKKTKRVITDAEMDRNSSRIAILEQENMFLEIGLREARSEISHLEASNRRLLVGVSRVAARAGLALREELRDLVEKEFGVAAMLEAPTPKANPPASQTGVTLPEDEVSGVPNGLSVSLPLGTSMSSIVSESTTSTGICAPVEAKAVREECLASTGQAVTELKSAADARDTVLTKQVPPYLECWLELANDVVGGCFNACSSLMAFTSTDPAKEKEVEDDHAEVPTGAKAKGNNPLTPAERQLLGAVKLEDDVWTTWQATFPVSPRRKDNVLRAWRKIHLSPRAQRCPSCLGDVGRSKRKVCEMATQTEDDDTEKMLEKKLRIAKH